MDWGAIGAATGIIALFFAGLSAVASSRSAKASEASASAAIWTNANALAPSIDLVAGNPELRERYGFTLANAPRDPTTSLPVPINPNTIFTTPGQADLIIAVGVELRVTNTGEVRTKIGTDAVCMTKGALNPLGSNEDLRSVVPDRAIELAPGKVAQFALYAGVTIDQWQKLGSPGGELRTDIRLSATAGPDGAVRHWLLSMSAPMLNNVPENASAVRVVAWTPPRVSLVEEPRTLPARARDSRRR